MCNNNNNVSGNVSGNVTATRHFLSATCYVKKNQTIEEGGRRQSFRFRTFRACWLERKPEMTKETQNCRISAIEAQGYMIDLVSGYSEIACQFDDAGGEPRNCRIQVLPFGLYNG